MSNVGGGELMFLVFVLAFLGLWVWALVDAARRPETAFAWGSKVGWIIALVVSWLFALGWLVAIVYLLGARRNPRAQTGA